MWGFPGFQARWSEWEILGRLGWSGSDKHLLRQRVPLCTQAKAEVKNMEEHDNKKRTAVWLTPGVIRRMGQLAGGGQLQNAQ